MTVRRALVSLVLALVLCPAQAQAQAAPRLAVFGAAQDAPLSDGERWAVIPVVGGMEVLDGAGATIRRRTVALAQQCGSQFGLPRGVGGALVVVECSFIVGQTRPRLLVYDLAARTFTEAAGTEVMYQSSDGATVNGIGGTWIAIGLSGHRGASTLVLLDWRTGRTVFAPRLAADRVRDLDAPSGSRRLCRPIRRPASSRRLFAYRSPFVIGDRGTSQPGSRLVLERCGGRSWTLQRSASTPRGVSLGSRAVTWVDGGAIRARALHGGATKRWRAPLGKAALGVAQLGRHLLVTIQGGPEGGARGFSFTVYRGRLP